jgi:PAS domain S-box-containing protein
MKGGIPIAFGIVSFICHCVWVSQEVRNMERPRSSLINADGFLQSIIDSCQDGIIVLDGVGCVLLYNSAALKILEPYGEISKGKHLSSIKREIWDAAQEMWASGLAQLRKRFELKFRNYVVNLTIVASPQRKIGILCVFQDITQLKKILSDIGAFPHTLEEMNAIIDSSYDGIHVIDDQGKVLKVNPSWERITGLNAKDVVGRNVRELLREGYYSNSVAAMVLKEKRHVTLQGEVLITGKKVLVSGNPIFDRNGKLRMVVNNVRDLTLIQRLCKEVQRSKNLTEKYQQKLEVIKQQSLKQEEIVAESRAMKDVMELAAQVAKTDAPVLITGETGVGKELVAEFIHRQSERSSKGLFLKINCGAIPENLLEAEFFGYESGSFTGADSRGKPGLFEFAEQGTLMLDEVGELLPKMQVKLLRAIQDLEITRIGGAKPRKIDVRLISVSNSSLGQMVEDGTFRKDLYFRLLVFPIHVPPLRERPDDILCFINYFLEKFNSKYGKKVYFPRTVTDNFVCYSWPGNVRELKHLVERLVIITPGNEAVREDLIDELGQGPISFPLSEFGSFRKAVRWFEASFIKKAIKQYGGVRQAATYLEMDPATIYRKLRKSQNCEGSCESAKSGNLPKIFRKG